MMQPIEFWVPGIPKPAGSKRAFAIKKDGVYTGKTVVIDACKKSGDWKSDVKAEAAKKYSGSPLTCPLSVSFTFFMPRPKGHFRSGKNSDVLRESAPPFPAVKPDTTKLIRGVEDAISGILWKDDAQIVRQTARKLYDDGRGPGCIVIIREP